MGHHPSDTPLALHAAGALANLSDGSTIVYDEPGDVVLQVGETVHIAIDGAAAHLFDAQGMALHG